MNAVAVSTFADLFEGHWFSVKDGEACDIAWARWPGERLFTFVEDAKVLTADQHGRAKAGWCYRKAGWKVAGRNKDGRLTILEIYPTTVQV